MNQHKWGVIWWGMKGTNQMNDRSVEWREYRSEWHEKGAGCDWEWRECWRCKGVSKKWEVYGPWGIKWWDGVRKSEWPSLPLRLHLFPASYVVSVVSSEWSEMNVVNELNGEDFIKECKTRELEVLSIILSPFHLSPTDWILEIERQVNRYSWNLGCWNPDGPLYLPYGPNCKG